MDPLPSGGPGPFLHHALPIRDATSGSLFNSESVKQNGGSKDTGSSKQSQVAATAILNSGDVIIEYIPPDHTSPESSRQSSYKWRVSSEVLAQNSPYFRALLDPNKFSEGRQLMKQKNTRVRQTTTDSESDKSKQPPELDEEPTWEDLPTVRLPSDHFSPKLGVDAIELFLRILSFGAFDDEAKRNFDAEIKSQRTSLVSRVIILADSFNSPHVVKETLKRSGYVYGRKTAFSKFDDQMLKLTEDRIRQSIFIANFLDDSAVFQVLTHTLIIVGSRSWANGVEKRASPQTFPWWYLSDGLEDFDELTTPTEELYYRRQCILNTITDLQAYFLRAYGALEETDDPKPTNAISFLGGNQSRHYQCRCGYGNSSACDMFHLGQMTRFFALRTKTVFLGSSLIDPDFGTDSDGDSDALAPPPSSTSERPTDISAIISSLKQCPDYQIDSNHTGCGIRRRFIPPLDCIEGLVGDRRGLLGVELNRWDATQWPLASVSWANRSLRRALVIEIHFARISAIPLMSPGLVLGDSREESARLFFTAKKRRWEA
ncbi:uncharacterized protein KD926_006105 [Aspergillus affinis]|uniref:uncharacterized protein n=1 Tax=Aspergillus affinis TaxID=1070780 RepID=UPI0022FE5530|nr:uncharacterized protein KD926_006105 [Aspergillus affinis]KAI9042186.1 hypothetical protein KD926_006105 [Aspergillus affinis]